MVFDGPAQCMLRCAPPSDFANHEFYGKAVVYYSLSTELRKHPGQGILDLIDK